MKDKDSILNMVRLPGRLTTSETAATLGFQPEHVPVLASEGLLKPLGKPAANGPKHYAAKDILGKADDVKWLSDATRILSAHWAKKNRANKPEQANPVMN